MLHSRQLIRKKKRKHNESGNKIQNTLKEIQELQTKKDKAISKLETKHEQELNELEAKHANELNELESLWNEQISKKKNKAKKLIEKNGQKMCSGCYSTIQTNEILNCV
eukprot:59920_1